MTITCPICNNEIPLNALQTDECHFTGLVACPDCKKDVSPVRPPCQEMKLEGYLKSWFETPETAREQFLSSIKNDQVGRIVVKVLRSYQLSEYGGQV